jgi:hypothetical protein
MEIFGSLISTADRQRLYDTMTNVENWRSFIPHAKSFEHKEDDSYEVVIEVDVGPIKGDQTVTLKLTEQNPPHSSNFEMHNSIVKNVKGNFTFLEPGDGFPEGYDAEKIEMPVPTPSTRTILLYKLDVDAGNPFVNGFIDMMKGKAKDGFDELLRSLEARAHNGN